MQRIADALGVTRVTLYAWESGDRLPKATMRKKFVLLCDREGFTELGKEWCARDVLEGGIDSVLVRRVMVRAQRRGMTVGDIAEWFGTTYLIAQGWLRGDAQMMETRRKRLGELADELGMTRVAGLLS